jgi:carbonic anhydrase
LEPDDVADRGFRCIRLRITFVVCFCVLAPAMRIRAGQIAEPEEHAEAHQHAHGGHHMNVPMGEETCNAQYTYDPGPEDPSHWGGMCSTGRMQAPIDVEHAEKLPINNLRYLYEPVDLDLINDCNRYRLLVRFPDNNWLKIGKKPYFLSELHFRAPGENAVHGRRPRMSIQLVHLSPESRFLIIEVPVVAGKENPAMKVMLEHVPERGKESKVAGAKMNAADFLPADRSFYRFPGSLTSPICNEEVMWYVMKNPVQFSEAQIAQYMTYYHNNARPLQPLHGRPVAESQ